MKKLDNEKMKNLLGGSVPVSTPTIAGSTIIGSPSGDSDETDTTPANDDDLI